MEGMSQTSTGPSMIREFCQLAGPQLLAAVLDGRLGQPGDGRPPRGISGSHFGGFLLPRLRQRLPPLAVDPALR